MPHSYRSAQYSLGTMYAYGTGVKKDYPEAMKCFRIPALLDFYALRLENKGSSPSKYAVQSLP